MDELDHLDFATDPMLDTLAGALDEYGMPRTEGTGLGMWRGMIEELNRSADAEGWDLPNRTWLVTPPAQVQEELSRAGVTAEQVVQRGGNVVDPQAVPVGLGFVEVPGSWSFGDGGKDLWGQVVPDGFTALVSRYEVWVTAPIEQAAAEVSDGTGETDTKEKKGKKAKPGKRAKSGTKGGAAAGDGTERFEVRNWMVFTRSGQAVEFAYRRRGSRSRFLGTGDPGGLYASLFAKSLGVDRPLLPGFPSLTRAEAVAGAAAMTLWAGMLQGHSAEEQARACLVVLWGSTAPYEPWAWWGDDDMGGHEDDDLGTQLQATMSTLREHGVPSWADALRRGPLPEQFVGEWFPTDPDLGDWAGDELLGQVVNNYMYENLAAMGEWLREDGHEDESALIGALLADAGLMLPAFMRPEA